MKKLFITTAVVILMASCGVQQQVVQLNRERFQNLTKDICIENEHEVRLAQALWKEIMKTK